MKKIINYLNLIRVKHYLKNGLIFLPLLFSGNLFDYSNLFTCIISFFIFSFTASIVYILNDIKDCEKDKLHKTKKNRPIASGAISLKEAILLILFLLILIICLLLIANINFKSILLLIIYFIINFGYSFGLKNIPILDITILTAGFVIRVLFGGAIVNIAVSNWLLLTVFSMAFYLALGKRRNEIKMINKDETRIVLKYYNIEFLDKFMYVTLSMAIVFYSLWSVDAVVINRLSKNLVWSVPFMILICMRYSMIIETDSDGDPVEVVMKDKVLLSLICVYILFLFLLLYL